MKIEKVEKLVTNIYNKTDNVIRIRNLEQALSPGVSLKRVHRVIKLNEKAWLKPYIDMNTKLRKTAKDNFEKDFFNLLNNVVFENTMENVKNPETIKM